MLIGYFWLSDTSVKRVMLLSSRYHSRVQHPVACVIRATMNTGFDPRQYQISWEVVGLEWGSLSLVTIIEELLGRIVAAAVCKTKNTDVGIRRADHATSLYPLKLTLTLPSSGGRTSLIEFARRLKPRRYSVMNIVYAAAFLLNLPFVSSSYCHIFRLINDG
jgi:hypothetical protein